MKNPFSISYGYHLAQALAARRKQYFIESVENLYSDAASLRNNKLPIELVCMFGKTSLPDAMLCISSFLRYAGKPSTITAVSDGTLSIYDKRNIEKLVDSCQVIELDDILTRDLPNVILKRVKYHWIVRKMALLMTLPKSAPALFMDSDILFFPGANQLSNQLDIKADRPVYLKDCQQSFDKNILREQDPVSPPLNSGLLYLPKAIDWTLPVSRFSKLVHNTKVEDTANVICHFTEQTMCHLAFHNAKAISFDPMKFILQRDDQFKLRDNYAKNSSTICRHYVGPVRHKMWLAYNKC